jgi:hypothetical protein
MKEDGRFYALLERLFKEIDQDSIQSEVGALRAAKPELSSEQLADHLTKRAAVRVASVGAAAGIPGGALGVLAMAPDIFNLVLQQSRLVLSIAFLYDRKPHLKRRFKEVLATLAVGTGASAGRVGVRVLVAKGLEHAVAAKLARKIFDATSCGACRRSYRSWDDRGASINYVFDARRGKAAVAYYSGGSRTRSDPRGRTRPRLC